MARPVLLPKPKHAEKPVRSVKTLSFDKGFFIASDHHFNHENIIGYCDRPFQNVRDMERFLIERHNSVVGKDDDVLFLGDFMWGRKTQADDVFPEMKRILRELNGRKFLIRGNHDYFYPEMYLKAGFLDVQERVVLDDVTFIHAPKQIFQQRIGSDFTDMPEGYALVVNSYMGMDIPGEYVCGHVHNAWKVLRPFVNVSVDVWDFTPAHSSEVREVLRNMRQPGNEVQKLGKPVLEALRKLREENDTSVSTKNTGETVDILSADVPMGFCMGR